jgi:FxsC-like protein
VKVAKETELADGDFYEEYESLPSAFGSWDDAPTLKIVTVAPRLEQLQQGQRRSAPYGPLAVDWNPYHPDITRPLTAIAADLARLQGFKADVGDFDDAAEAMLEVGHYGDGPVLLLIDPWALRDPQRRERLSQVDAVAPPWTTVMVPWNRHDPDNGKEGAPDPADLEEVTPRLLRLGRSASRMSVSGVGTPEAFREVFSLVVHQASAEFARLGSGPPPSRPRLYGPFSSPEAHGDRSA